MGNIRCKGCKAIISGKEKKCPFCGNPAKRFFDLTGASSFFGYLAAAIVAILLLRSCFSPERNESSEETSNKCSSIMAHIMANDFVQKRLISPSTAKFPKFSDPGVRILEDDECVFSVFSYVDSQNKFGAMIRTEFVAVVFREGSHNGNVWKAKQISFFE